MRLVCHESPARHTCYKYVAKICISVPLPYIVWTQQSVPLSTCVSILPLLHAANLTHTWNPPMHKKTHQVRIPQIYRYSRSFENQIVASALVCVHSQWHIEQQEDCVPEFWELKPSDARLWFCNHKAHLLSLVSESWWRLWKSCTSDAEHNDGPPDAQWNAQWSWSLLRITARFLVDLLFHPPLSGREPL